MPSISDNTCSTSEEVTPRNTIRANRRWLIPTISAIVLVPLAIAALNPSVPPGGNFDLSYWNLQLPTGSSGDPTTIHSAQLVGDSGYENFTYFFTESGDGAMVMKVPGSPDDTGCVTTPNSTHCRTELAETSSWSPNNEPNRLYATLAVTKADPTSYGTVVGQIHMDSSVSTKPVCELYYNQNGDINIGVEQTRSGDDEKFTYLTNVPLGATFSYELKYESNTLVANINGNWYTLSTYSLDAPLSYFKAGNYNQSTDSQSGASDVHFLSLSIVH